MKDTKMHSPSEHAEQSGTDEYVAFRLAEQDFCINITAVREIRGWSPTTPMPHTPEFISGLINLRGAVIPIIDLSLRFGFTKTQTTERHVIIVVQVSNQSVGLLVDSVSDILTVGDDKLQPTPEVGSEIARAFVTRIIANEDGRMIRVIDLGEIVPHCLGDAA